MSDVYKILEEYKKETQKILKSLINTTNENLEKIIEHIKKQEKTIEKIKEEIRTIERQIYVDYLTGVNNQNFYRTFFMTEKYRRMSDKEFLKKMKNYLLETNDNLSLFYIDFANFKKANDYGHTRVDEVLRLWGNYFLSKNLFTAIRMGGDEFLLIGSKNEIDTIQKEILDDSILNACNKPLFNETTGNFFIRTIPVGGEKVISKEKLLEEIENSFRTENSLKNLFVPLIEKAEIRSFLNKELFKYYSLGYHQRESGKIKKFFDYSLKEVFNLISSSEMQKTINALIKQKYENNLSNKEIIDLFRNMLINNSNGFFLNLEKNKIKTKNQKTHKRF